MKTTQEEQLKKSTSHTSSDRIFEDTTVFVIVWFKSEIEFGNWMTLRMCARCATTSRTKIQRSKMSRREDGHKTHSPITFNLIALAKCYKYRWFVVHSSLFCPSSPPSFLLHLAELSKAPSTWVLHCHRFKVERLSLEKALLFWLNVTWILFAHILLKYSGLFTMVSYQSLMVTLMSWSIK